MTAKRAPRTQQTVFMRAATGYIDEHAIALGRCGTDREASMRSHAEIMNDWMIARGYDLPDCERPVVLEMLMFLAGRTAFDADVATGGGLVVPPVPEGLDPQASVTFAEALALPGLAGKRSTFKRAKSAGTLKHTLNPAGIQVFRVADLYVAAGRKASGAPKRGRPRSTTGYSQGVLDNMYSLFKEICDYAITAHGIAVPSSWRSLKTPKSVKTATRPAQHRPVASLTQVATIAAQLHVVHQTVLWLLRILGPRVSEVYGILIKDIYDLGPGNPGLLWIHRQGGRKHGVRDPKTGRISNVDAVDRVKTEQSNRVVVIPPTLMVLIRHVIAIFHTDDDGTVDKAARLIPGLRKDEAGGISGFVAAVRKLPITLNLVTSPFGTDEGVEDYLRTHDLRRSQITVLEGADLDENAVRRFAGHLVGTDVHSGYILDDPRYGKMLEIAEFLETEIRSEIGDSLMIPTAVSCTTGQQQALQTRRGAIEPALIALGWYAPAADESGDLLLGSRQVAEMLGIASTTARRWMREGTISARSIRRDGKVEWVSTIAHVTAFRAE